MPVAMKDLKCKGGELQIQECNWAPPDASCSGHLLDSVVYCGNDGTAGVTTDGSFRILSHDGSPNIDGEGRLEIFKAGSWAPVCQQRLQRWSRGGCMQVHGLRRSQLIIGAENVDQ